MILANGSNDYGCNNIAVLSHDITALSFSLVIFIMDHGLETCIFRNQS